MKPARHAAGESVRRTATPAAREPHERPAEPANLADSRAVPQTRVRHDGWTATRQRTFLSALAETGCISEACAHAGVSSRSVYRLRQRADAAHFAADCSSAFGSIMPPA
jgi:hypothetical protein